MTANVQGILLTCLHLPGDGPGGEQVRLEELKRICKELEKKGLWRQQEAGGVKQHIFAGDFNSLTEEDKDKEGWEKVRRERAAKNSKLEEAISLSQRKQELENLSRGAKAELEEVTAQLAQSLEDLNIEPRGPSRKLISHLKFKKLEELKFDLTKLMLEEKGFKDAWRDVGEYGQTGNQTTCK